MNTITLHGVYMNILDTGVLLCGPSGIGKSELALDLIDRGHQLISDDAPEFYQTADGKINGRCPQQLQDFLEVRGLGILNVRRLFGDKSITKQQYLELSIQLIEDKTNHAHNRLHGTYDYLELFDQSILQLQLAPTKGRHFALLVECAVRKQLLQQQGYDATQALRHQIKQQGEVL